MHFASAGVPDFWHIICSSSPCSAAAPLVCITLPFSSCCVVGLFPSLSELEGATGLRWVVTFVRLALIYVRLKS